MSNASRDDLTDRLRGAMTSVTEDVVVPADLADRVRDGRRRAHRRSVIVGAALPAVVLVAGAAVLGVGSLGDGDRPAEVAAPGPTTDVTFRLVASSTSADGSSAREKECARADGFTAPMTDGELSIDEASGGCLTVLLGSDERPRLTGTVFRKDDTLAFELRGTGSNVGRSVSVVVTDVDARRALVARHDGSDLVLSQR